jgi:hypothetical protein
MGDHAKVTSIEAIDEFAAALRCFQNEASDVLEALGRGTHRVVQWIQQDQKQYWTHQLRRSDQKLQEAKVNLHRCQTFKRIGDYRPSCAEEKQALARAKRRMQVCREKLEAVRKWSQAIERAVFEYMAGVGQLSQWTESDAERALGLLKRISRTLEEYLAAETSPQAVAAMERLPWTDQQWEEELEHEEHASEEGAPEKAESAADAADGSEASGGHEHASEGEAS